MTANLSAVTAAAQTYGDERAADQKGVDDVRYNALQAQYDQLVKDFDAYKAAHPDTPVPPQPTPPQDATTLFGSSVNGPLVKPISAGGLGYTTMAATRVYLRALPKGSTWNNIVGDGGATSDLADAVKYGTKLLWLSVKESDPTLLDAFLKTMPKNLGMDVWGTFHHEPENDAPAYPATQFVKEFRLTAPVFRKYGLKTATILMRYTFGAGSGRNWKDWWPGEAFVDIFGCDSYNTANKKGSYSDVKSQLDPIRVAAESVGKGFAIGETGASVFNGKPQPRTDWVKALHDESIKQGALAMLYWDQDSYAFDKASAEAWLGPRA